jgi:hypothetical protein
LRHGGDLMSVKDAPRNGTVNAFNVHTDGVRRNKHGERLGGVGYRKFNGVGYALGFAVSMNLNMIGGNFEVMSQAK